jgi:predicted lactoylglutathione lyase
MAAKVYINLPVKDLRQSIGFFSNLGFKIDPLFTDENASCMAVSDEVNVMLLSEKFFRKFSSKRITDAKTETEVILTVTMDSREKVDEIVTSAMKAGALPSLAAQDHEFMYQKSFQDLDGHLWEIMYIDPVLFNTHAY